MKDMEKELYMLTEYGDRWGRGEGSKSPHASKKQETIDKLHYPYTFIAYSVSKAIGI